MGPGILTGWGCCVEWVEVLALQKIERSCEWRRRVRHMAGRGGASRRLASAAALACWVSSKQQRRVRQPLGGRHAADGVAYRRWCCVSTPHAGDCPSTHLCMALPVRPPIHSTISFPQWYCRYRGSADAIRKNIIELKDEARGITPARDYIILSGSAIYSM